MNNHPRIIEIVGLAGTGKSTLVRALQKRNEQIKIFPLPKTWFYGSLTKRAPLWLPIWFQSRGSARGFTREELISLGCIDTWLPFIQRKISTNQDIAIMEPGSVYWLTKLQGFGWKSTGQSRYQCWLQNKFEQWSAAVDVMIWLDAPEELCLKRVLGREQWHDAKAMDSEDILERFRGLRKSYEQIILKMVSKRPRKVFHFLTDQISTEEILDRIFSEMPFIAPAKRNGSIERHCSKDPSDYSTQPHIDNSPFLSR
jgi:thymidylate kinase